MSRRVSIEEVYDDEGVRPRYVLSLQTHILEEDLRAELDPTAHVNIPPPEAPPSEPTRQIPPVCLLPKKRKPEGLSTLGISVLWEYQYYRCEAKLHTSQKALQTYAWTLVRM